MNIKQQILAVAQKYNIEGSGSLYGREKELLLVIKNCPVLYDYGLPEYKSSFTKDQAWTTIAQVFHVNKQEVKLKWKALREHYRRRKLQINKCADTSNALMSELSFLDNYPLKRLDAKTLLKRKGKKPSYSYDSDDTEQISPEEHNLTEENFTIIVEENVKQEEDTEESFVLSSSDLEFEELKKDDDPLCNLNCSNITENLATSSEADRKNLNENFDSHKIRNVDNFEDEDQLFAKTIAAELRKISSNKKKIRLKADIYRLISNAVSDDE